MAIRLSKQTIHKMWKKRGGVGLYVKDSLPSKNRSDLVTLPECIVYEIQLNKKKYFFVVAYRSPSQNQTEFDNFTIDFELMLSKMHAENPFCVIITGDFNCRSTQWWENVSKARKGIGLLKYLSNYLPRNSLNELLTFSPLRHQEDTKCLAPSTRCINLRSIHILFQMWLLGLSNLLLFSHKHWIQNSKSQFSRAAVP